MFCGCPVYGQQVISCVQSSTPGNKWERTEFLFTRRLSAVSLEEAYLSTTLPDLILSMTMTCLLRWLAEVSVTPSVAPGDLRISTSSGPEALATVSGGHRQRQQEPPRRCWFGARQPVPTHNCDIVLDLEQGFLSTLGQHAQGVAVGTAVQRHAVDAEEPIPGPQRALPEHAHTGQRSNPVFALMTGCFLLSFAPEKRNPGFYSLLLSFYVDR